jgi:hypothetical protein
MLQGISQQTAINQSSSWCIYADPGVDAWTWTKASWTGVAELLIRHGCELRSASTESPNIVIIIAPAKSIKTNYAFVYCNITEEE